MPMMFKYEKSLCCWCCCLDPRLTQKQQMKHFWFGQNRFTRLCLKYFRDKTQFRPNLPNVCPKCEWSFLKSALKVSFRSSNLKSGVSGCTTCHRNVQEINLKAEDDSFGEKRNILNPIVSQTVVIGPWSPTFQIWAQNANYSITPYWTCNFMDHGNQFWVLVRVAY